MTDSSPAAVLPVSVEVGKRRSFAWVHTWPGWCRAGKTDELAIEALGAYVPRYAAVAADAGLELPAGAGDAFEVTERVPGSATTDFGAPAEVVASDRGPVGADEAVRAVVLLRAAWSLLDRLAV